MTRISRITLETNRITILQKRYASNDRCKNCGKQMDSTVTTATDAIAIDKMQRIVELDVLPIAQRDRAWHQALLSRFLRSIGKTPPS
jgi:hypothetical protein